MVGSSTAKQYSTVQCRQIGGRIVLAHKKQKRWSRMQIKLLWTAFAFLLACLPLLCHQHQQQQAAASSSLGKMHRLRTN
jgi:hypothetical protein